MVDRQVLTVIVVGVIIGISGGIIVESLGSGGDTGNGIDLPGPSDDGSVSGPDDGTAGVRRPGLVLVHRSTEELRNATYPDTADIVDGEVMIAEGETSVEVYRSPILHLEELTEMEIKTMIPAPDRSSITMYVVGSQDSNISADRTGEQVRQVELVNGTNGFSDVTDISGPYYQIQFSLQRDTPTVPTPAIRTYRVWGLPSQ